MEKRTNYDGAVVQKMLAQKMKNEQKIRFLENCVFLLVRANLAQPENTVSGQLNNLFISSYYTSVYQTLILSQAIIIFHKICYKKVKFFKVVFSIYGVILRN